MGRPEARAPSGMDTSSAGPAAALHECRSGRSLRSRAAGRVQLVPGRSVGASCRGARFTPLCGSCACVERMAGRGNSAWAGAGDVVELCRAVPDEPSVGRERVRTAEVCGAVPGDGSRDGLPVRARSARNAGRDATRRASGNRPAVRAATMRSLITFNHNFRACAARQIPSLRRYRRSFRLLRARYPHVPEFSPWNERRPAFYALRFVSAGRHRDEPDAAERGDDAGESWRIETFVGVRARGLRAARGTRAAGRPPRPAARAAGCWRARRRRPEATIRPRSPRGSPRRCWSASAGSRPGASATHPSLHLPDQRLRTASTPSRAAAWRSRSASAATQAATAGASSRGVGREQDDRSHAVGVAQREVCRVCAAVAAPDDDRRCRGGGIEQRVGGGVLADTGALVGLWARAAHVAAAVVDASQSGELIDRVGPCERRAAGAVDAQDRGTIAAPGSRAGSR